MAPQRAEVALARCQGRQHRSAPVTGFEPLAANLSNMAWVLARKPVTCVAQPAPGSFEAGCERPADLCTLKPFPA
jgi:hypothetical protein